MIGAVGTRVLIVDDHPTFRRLAAVLLASGGYEVVGEAVDGEDALRQVERCRPDLVLLDVLLPGMNGFVVARRLAERGDGPRVVLVSSADRSQFTAALDGAPVCGFLGKHELTLDQLAQLLDQDGGRPRMPRDGTPRG